MRKFLPSMLCIAATLCLGIGLTACGDEKNDEISLTAETDFTALVSEKVDENGWKKALSLKDYGVNFTNSLKVGQDESYLVKYNINELFYHGTVTDMIFEASIKKDIDETISYYYYDHTEKDGFKFKLQKDNEEYAEYSDLYNFYKAMYCPDFSDNFSSFTYDETKHAYVCTGTVEGTALFETFEPDGSAAKENYSNVEIKIVNGRLAYLSADGNENGIVSKFYDFGKTTITYQDVEEVVGEDE